ncbi:DUF362 domain-containing protein [bacterium]|nr:DUF362 domain-containing protein [bacterium]
MKSKETSKNLYKVKNQDKVLIKPNMLSARKPEEGVTTNPVILEEIIKRIKSKEIEK